MSMAARSMPASWNSRTWRPITSLRAMATNLKRDLASPVLARGNVQRVERGLIDGEIHPLLQAPAQGILHLLVGNVRRLHLEELIIGETEAKRAAVAIQPERLPQPAQRVQLPALAAIGFAAGPRPAGRPAAPSACARLTMPSASSKASHPDFLFFPNKLFFYK
jgi:hypothetical protein